MQIADVLNAASLLLGAFFLGMFFVVPFLDYYSLNVAGYKVISVNLAGIVKGDYPVPEDISRTVGFLYILVTVGTGLLYFLTGDASDAIKSRDLSKVKEASKNCTWLLLTPLGIGFLDVILLGGFDTAAEVINKYLLKRSLHIVSVERGPAFYVLALLGGIMFYIFMLSVHACDKLKWLKEELEERKY